MTTEASDRPSDRVWWPCFLGGVVAVPAGAVLENWLPRAIAGGLGFFVASLVVGIVFSMSPPTSKWTFVRWIAGGAVGAIVGTTIVLMLD